MQEKVLRIYQKINAMQIVKIQNPENSKKKIKIAFENKETAKSLW